MTTEDRVLDLGMGVYLVDGKLIAAYEPGMFDGEDGRRSLLAMAHASFDRYRMFKEAGWTADVPVVMPARGSAPGAKYEMACQGKAGALPEPVKDALRKAFPEYA